MCLKQQKQVPGSAGGAITKPDTDRKYRGRKPQDDSWIEGGRRQLPAPVAQIRPSNSQEAIRNDNGHGNDMGDQAKANNGHDDFEGRDSEGKVGMMDKGQRGSTREIKINDVRNNLKETVKLK